MPKIPCRPATGLQSRCADPRERAISESLYRDRSRRCRSASESRRAPGLRKGARNTSTESITLSLERRQVTPDPPVTQFFGEGVPGGWVDFDPSLEVFCI